MNALVPPTLPALELVAQVLVFVFAVGLLFLAALWALVNGAGRRER